MAIICSVRRQENRRQKGSNTMATIKKVISELENMFEMFNDEYYNGELDRPVITVAPNNTGHKVSGWCTNYKAWEDKDGGYYEINICAEFLNRPTVFIAAEMLHEMVHLYCLKNNIQDTSRGGTWHNKRFCEIAKTHGLIVGEDSQYGCITTIDLSAEEFFNTYYENESFDLFRIPEKKEKKGGGKSNSRKYVCPCCGLIIRATKDVRVICADCNELMLKED